MKFTKAILIISLIGCISCKNSNIQNNKPILNFDRQIINVGDIKYGNSYSGRIILRNKGEGELKIGDISTDCACTVADITKKVVLSGDSININYKVNPHAMGFFQQKIIIQNNSDSNPVMFVIRGKAI